MRVVCARVRVMVRLWLRLAFAAFCLSFRFADMLMFVNLYICRSVGVCWPGDEHCSAVNGKNYLEDML